jgi:uncharacterized protein involved in exopolysaccharide biosynthesis
MLLPPFSTECARKPSADDFPRNFALIRLAEKTLERQKKEEEQKAKQLADEINAAQMQEMEIAEL